MGSNACSHLMSMAVECAYNFYMKGNNAVKSCLSALVIKMAKTALITGGSRGIGRACAIALAKNGYDIILNYANNDQAADEVLAEILSYNVNAMKIKADVSNPDEVKSMFAETKKFSKTLDVLINNAGIVKDQFVMMLDHKTVNKCVCTNICGCIYCTQYAALRMYRNKSGVIINVSSISSTVALPGQTVYSATKGAINSFTHTSAKELSGYGIRVNAVAPGFVKTTMIDELDDEKKKQYLDLIPMHSFSDAEDVANAVLFLCSDNAKYITGHILNIDGGLSL